MEDPRATVFTLSDAIDEANKMRNLFRAFEHIAEVLDLVRAAESRIGDADRSMTIKTAALAHLDLQISDAQTRHETEQSQFKADKERAQAEVDAQAVALKAQIRAIEEAMIQKEGEAAAADKTAKAQNLNMVERGKAAFRQMQEEGQATIQRLDEEIKSRERVLATLEEKVSSIKGSIENL